MDCYNWFFKVFSRGSTYLQQLPHYIICIALILYERQYTICIVLTRVVSCLTHSDTPNIT